VSGQATRTLAVVLATAGGVGYSPVAPGTCGSLVALPLLPALASLRERSLLAYLVVLAAVVAGAIWSAGRAEGVFGHDSGRIVVDEVAGMVVAGLFLPGTWLAAALGFAAFRLFDILKPPPAGRIDRGFPGGLGVVGDDLVAGVYAGIAARLVLGIFMWEVA
jgi:phosphatidylglycerophosphatase A